MLQLEQGDQLSATFHLQRLLQQSAHTHRSLLQLASATAVDVPPEAALTAGRSTNEELGPRVLQWSDYVAAGAADWQDFDDEGAFWAPHARPQLPSACVCSQTGLSCCTRILQHVQLSGWQPLEQCSECLLSFHPITYRPVACQQGCWTLWGSEVPILHDGRCPCWRTCRLMEGSLRHQHTIVCLGRELQSMLLQASPLWGT